MTSAAADAAGPGRWEGNKRVSATLNGMTRLTEISDHSISLQCQCGHHSLLPVADLLERVPEASVADVVARTVCAECGERGRVLHMRIVGTQGGDG